jgi:hypothetical protein
LPKSSATDTFVEAANQVVSGGHLRKLNVNITAAAADGDAKYIPAAAAQGSLSLLYWWHDNIFYLALESMKQHQQAASDAAWCFKEAGLAQGNREREEEEERKREEMALGDQTQNGFSIIPVVGGCCCQSCQIEPLQKHNSFFRL